MMTNPIPTTIYQVSDLWKGLRGKNIGGSEIAALFGEGRLSAFQLWNEKHGLLEHPNLDDNERVQAGRFMEPGAVAWANSKWKRNFFRPGVYVEHATVEGMACTPDCYELGDTGVMAQVKIVDGLQFAIHWKADGDDIIEAPLDILLQVQHEMECCQKHTSWLIVLVGGNRLYRMICEYDPQIGGLLRTKVTQFWARTTAPEPDFTKDGSAIRALRRTLPVKEYADFTGNEHLYGLLKEAKKLSVEKNRMVDSIGEVHAEIEWITGHAENIRCGDITLTFTKRKGTPDKEITAADVGTVIKGRAESLTPKITMEGISL